MQNYKRIIQEAVKSKSERLNKAIQTDKLLNRLANISTRLEKGSITPKNAGELYKHEASRAANIKKRIASLKGR